MERITHSAYITNPLKHLETIKFSTNPYNINRLTNAAGIAALASDSYFSENCSRIMETRSWTKAALEELGFKRNQIYTTMELRMKCGVGKCGRCNIGKKYVCKDGPVFTCDELDEMPDEY